MLVATSSSEEGKELSTQWVLIVNFSGLGEIYPVRVTRSMPFSLLTKQFNGHLLRCGRSMDKVLYAIKNRILGHDVCYNMLLATIKGYLENPNAYSYEQGIQFEDFIIKEYCEYYMDQKNIKVTVKQQTLDSLLENRRRRKVNESYLSSTFAEDFTRTQGELLKILNDFKI